MSIPFSGASVYRTHDGYLVELDNERFTKKEFSPGVCISNLTAINNGRSKGWVWEENGTIILAPPWDKALELTSRVYEMSSIPKPPEGYRYKDGYPKYVTIPSGQPCMTTSGILTQFDFHTASDYIPVEKILKKDECKFSGAGVYLTVGGYLVQLDSSGRSTPETSVGTWKGNHDNGTGWLWYMDGTILIDSPWDKLLQLKEKLEIPSIPKEPEGYSYENEYPQYRKIKKGEIGLTMWGSVFTEYFKETLEPYIPLKSTTVWYDVTNDPNYIIQEGDQYQTTSDPSWNRFDRSIGRKLMNSEPYSSRGFKARSKIEPVKYYEITDPNYRVHTGDLFPATSVKGETWLICGTLLEGSTLDSLKSSRGIEKVRSIHPHIPIIIDGAGVYETSGGYLVELDENFTSQTPVPGILESGSSHIHTADKLVWQNDGSIRGMNSEWTEKLRIVTKLKSWQAIPQPPDGYKYSDNYPQYRYIEPNELFMDVSTGLLDQNSGIDKTIVKAIPICKIEPKYYECDNPDPNYVIRKGDQYFACGKWHNCYFSVGSTVDKTFSPILKMRSLSPLPQKEEVWYTITNPDYILKTGDQCKLWDNKNWTYIVTEVGTKFEKSGLCRSAVWVCRSKNKEACLSNVPKETPELNFNLGKAVDLTATPVKPSLLKRSLNWWVVEPISNAFRYAVITAVLWGGVEIYKNPAVVWKILPKISVSVNK